jgi:hypothetical protein
VPACRTTRRVSQHSSGPPLPYWPRSIFPQSSTLPAIKRRFEADSVIRLICRSLKSSAWTLKMFTLALAAVVFEGCTGNRKATDVCRNAIKCRTWCTQTRHWQNSIRWTDLQQSVVTTTDNNAVYEGMVSQRGRNSGQTEGGLEGFSSVSPWKGEDCNYRRESKNFPLSKVHLRTDHECPEGGRGIAILFL